MIITHSFVLYNLYICTLYIYLLRYFILLSEGKLSDKACILWGQKIEIAYLCVIYGESGHSRKLF